MREFELVVLVPPPYGPRPLYRRLLSVWRRRLQGQYVNQYGGHSAVTRSLVQGLRQQLGLRWKLVTDYNGETSEVIHVLAHPDFVRAGIIAKREGRCDRLIVGPNINVLPHEDDAIQASPEVDRVIVPSESMVPIYEVDVPALVGRVCSWPAGIDVDYWVPPLDLGRRKSVLVYAKRRPPEDGKRALEYLKASGYNVVELTYGAHRLDEYRAALEESFAMVFLTDGESQGIAMFEAWAMNVPTLVNTWSRPLLAPSPYLTASTGALWDNVDELPDLLESTRELRPREWVLANGTDAVSAQRLLYIAGLRPPPEVRN